MGKGRQRPVEFACTNQESSPQQKEDKSFCLTNKALYMALGCLDG